MKLLKSTLSGEGKVVIIRLDQIASIQHDSWLEHDYGRYWSTKITLICGKEINIRENFDNIEKIWCESLGFVI